MQRRQPAAAKTQGSAGEDRPARERLLAVAGELFYRQGIRSVGVDEIIAAADVAKMSLYRSFASKDALIAAYLRERDESYWRHWDAVIEHHPEGPRAQLLALFRSLARRAARPEWRGCPFTNAATEFPEPEHPARRVAEAHKRELRRRLRGLARATGADDAAALADQLVLLFEGVYASVQTFGAKGPAAAVVQAVDAVIAAQLH
jgi:AcrR family transcriptional regulator